MAKERWSGRERDALMFAAALEHNLNSDVSRTLEKRIRASGKTAWRDWRLAGRLVNKVLNLVLDTLPPNNYGQLDEMLKRSTLRFVFPGPIRTPFYCVIRQEDMEEIGWHAMNGACRYCLKTAEDAENCALCKALRSAAPLPDGPRGDLDVCEYAQCVFDREDGHGKA